MIPTCRDMAEAVTEYQEGTLPWYRYPMYWLHAWMCPPCRHYRDQVAKTAAAAGAAQAAADQAAPAPEVPGELLAALKQEAGE